MPTIDMRAYARRGAEARLAELNAEMADIYRAFPALRKEAHDPPFIRRGPKALRIDGGTAAGGRKRKGMTAAQRKAVGERMKKYWAERRAESAAKKR